MKTQLAFCSTCGRDVRVLVTNESAEVEAQANIPDAEIVCLEIGDTCSGGVCPVSAVSHAAMVVRRVRAGVRDVLQPLVKVECEVCGRVTDYFLIDREYATCGECGTTLRRDRIDPLLGRDG